MKKRMFSKFTNILHQAVEALAPQLTLLEEFTYHWKAVTTYFIDSKGDQLPIDQTSLPTHLDQMIVLLQEEENSLENDSTGPCMEYLLQHKLLETLYSLGRTDHPPGMKQVVLQFFTKLLSRLKQPLLGHVNVHRAVSRLVKVCGEVKAAPSESEEIQFLCTVCSLIKSSPYLVNFFIDVPKPKVSSIKSSQTKEESKSSEPALDPTPLASGHSPASPSDQRSSTSLDVQQDFSLVSALITLTHSADSRVAVKACEGLMLCASLPEESAAKCIVHNTQFCTELTQRLVEAYIKLPSYINPVELETVEAKWGLDVITESEDQQTFLGKRHLVSFLSWLDYCDQLISIANPIVAKALATSVRQLFLDVLMEPSLLQTSESGSILATAYLSRCLRTVCSHPLLSEFCHFILGDCKSPETQDEESHKIRERLIERCNHLSEEVSLVTLKLFDILLQKDDEHIIHNLVLRNLIGRSYRRVDPPENEQDPKDIQGLVNGVASSETSSSVGDGDTGSESSQPASPTLSSPSTSPRRSRTEVHKIVNSFLTLLPEELKSSYQTADSGYDMYLRDAHKQFNDVKTMCDSWSWPTAPVCIENFDIEPFYEGSFMHMILDRLSHLMNQSYAINLQVTSVVSKLALFPHPNIGEFLLDPFLPVKEGTKTLFTIFQKIANEIRTKLYSDSDLSNQLVMARKILMGTVPNINRLEGQSQLEAIIVMEEFCKELSAIAFVKHHAQLSMS